MRFVHYSHYPICNLRDSFYYHVDRYSSPKPKGMWFSVEGEAGDNWKDWCQGERFMIQCLAFEYEITFKENARLLYLDQEEKLIEFSYSHRDKKEFTIWNENFIYKINWVEIYKEYQGIIIYPYHWNCRLLLETSWYYGWDCASGCFWDKDAVESFRCVNGLPMEL